MKIAMFTNTYLPHVGGVANSVKTFADEFRALGHQVKVIAPEFPGAEESTEDILRVSAIQNFNGSDFSVRLALPNMISEYLDAFDPDVIHSHHPFLLGDAALRVGCNRNIPVVFTHHTLYENYTHYVPLDSEALKRAAIQLAVEYANLCTAVIAPSESVERLLQRRGVETPVVAIPTGIDLKRFRCGNGALFRKRLGISADATVIGHVGRLAEEKNLHYLADAIGRYLSEDPTAVALIVGSGPATESTAARLQEWASTERIFMAGKRTGRELVNAYTAMDLFAFSSHSETQGMVLAEAMAAGKPVVALDAPGAREIVCDGVNGRLLPADASPDQFAAAITSLMKDQTFYNKAKANVLTTARQFSKRRSARKTLALYERLAATFEKADDAEPGATWDRVQRRIELEWDLLTEKASAAAASFAPTDATEVELA
ncbi:MAG: glycosyltransferase [Verrucomicrobiae bacterium]|nr:glycosyltransferase [Verrucomicrobiae bacterium]